MEGKILKILDLGADSLPCYVQRTACNPLQMLRRVKAEYIGSEDKQNPQSKASWNLEEKSFLCTSKSNDDAKSGCWDGLKQRSSN